MGVAVAEALEEVGAEESGEAAVPLVLGGVDEFVGHDEGLGGEVAAQEDAVSQDPTGSCYAAMIISTSNKMVIRSAGFRGRLEI